MKQAIELLKLFLDVTPMEDITHLKYVMSEKDLDSFIQGWIQENAMQLISENQKKTQIENSQKQQIKTLFPEEKTIQLKKTYHLKVTVENVEMRADE